MLDFFNYMFDSQSICEHIYSHTTLIPARFHKVTVIKSAYSIYIYVHIHTYIHTYIHTCLHCYKSIISKLRAAKRHIATSQHRQNPKDLPEQARPQAHSSASDRCGWYRNSSESDRRDKTIPARLAPQPLEIKRLPPGVIEADIRVPLSVAVAHRLLCSRHLRSHLLRKKGKK